MAKRSTLFLLGFVLLLWGSAFPAIRAALPYYPPTHLAALRFLIASLGLGALCWRHGFPRLETKDLPLVLLNGIVGVGFYNLFLNTGQRTVDAGAASLLVNTAPIWTVTWSVLFLRERPDMKSWCGLGVSFVGVVLVTLRHGHNLELNHGALLVLGASLAHSIYIVLMKRNVAKLGAIAATTYAVWAGAAFLLVFSRGLWHTVHTVPLQATLLIVYLGLFPAALAYVLWGFILERFPASRAVSFLYFVPIVAFVIAWVWLHETPTWNTLLGGILIITGVAMVNRSASEKMFLMKPNFSA